MRLHELNEGLDANQKRAGQVAGEESAKSVGPVLGNKQKQHPFKGRLVGEDAVNEVAPPGMEDWIKDRKADFKKRYGDRWQEVLYATAWKRKNNESAEGSLNEFAPSDGNGGEEDNLHKYARMWYNGDLGTQQQVEQILDRMGWEIGEIESEEGGAFVVRSGDENGNSYIGFAVEDLTEGNEEKIADRYDQDEWDEKMQHLKKLAGLGPLKTVWDPEKRVYKNVPVNQEKK